MNTIKRSKEVDIIRLFALIGICMVNIPFMALPTETAFIAPSAFLDKAAAFFIEFFFQLKFFILFSFIFGWGMAVQSQAAQAKGQAFATRYFRRMGGLAVLGVAHAIFVFSGDILLLYAVFGVLLWLIKDYPTKKLMKIAALMLPLSFLFLTVLAIAIDTAMASDNLLPTIVGRASLGGGFLEATQARFTDWPFTFVFLLLLQGPLVFSAFAMGLAAAKSDFFKEKSDGIKLLHRSMPILFIIALPLNALYAAVISGVVPETYELLTFLGFVLIAIGAPALSLIYLYGLIRFSRTINVPNVLILAGRNSLSCYVAQGVLAGFIFGSYGLGLFDTFNHAALIPISLLIALASIIFVGFFAKYFKHGPLEPFLRVISGK